MDSLTISRTNREKKQNKVSEWVYSWRIDHIKRGQKEGRPSWPLFGSHPLPLGDSMHAGQYRAVTKRPRTPQRVSKEDSGWMVLQSPGPQPHGSYHPGPARAIGVCEDGREE